MNKNKRNELNDLSFLCMNNQSLGFAEDRSFIKIFGKKFNALHAKRFDMETEKLT